MKRVLNALLIFHCVSLAAAPLSVKDTPEVTQQRLFYPDGKLKAVQTLMKNDAGEYILNGPQCTFSPEGKPQSEGMLIGNLLFGEWKEIDKSGNLAVGSYEQNLKNGEWKYYSNSGKLRKQENYTAGKLNGDQTTYYENDSVASKSHFLMGKLNGRQELFHSNGQKALSIEWIEGYEHGEAKAWNEKGSVLEEKYYFKGVPIGTWKWYNNSGEPLRTSLFNEGCGTNYEYLPGKDKNELYLYQETPLVAGKAHGTCKTFYPDGSPCSSLEYQEGIKQGAYKEWETDATTKVTGQFSKGYPDGQWDLYKNNTLYQHIYYQSPTQSNIVEYAPAGHIIYDMQLTDNSPHGKYTEFYENGVVLKSGKFHKGKREGRWKEFFSDGNIKQRISYFMDKPHGAFEEWYEQQENSDPQRKIKGSHINGVRGGKWQEWYPSGKLRKEISYRSGCLDGPFKEYWESLDATASTPILKLEGAYALGERHGEWQEWYENKLLKQRANFKEGLQDGIAEEWFDYLIEGKTVLKYHTEHKEGKKYGDWLSYYRNGVPQLGQQYQNDKLHGIVQAFYETGVVQYRCNYENDKLSGESLKYHANKKLEEKAQYKDGLLHGKIKSYHFNGHIAVAGEYNRGLPIGTWEWYSDNSKTPIQTEAFVEGTGTLYTFYSKGKMKQETHLVKGIKDGKESRWYPDGKLRSEVSFVNGNLDGLYVEYHDNGTIIEKSLWAMGQRNGLYQTWYGNNEKKEEFTFAYGLLNGKAQEWHENGHIKSSGEWRTGFKHGTWKFQDRYSSEPVEQKYLFGVLTDSKQAPTNEPLSIQ